MRYMFAVGPRRLEFTTVKPGTLALTFWIDRIRYHMEDARGVRVEHPIIRHLLVARQPNDGARGIELGAPALKANNFNFNPLSRRERGWGEGRRCRARTLLSHPSPLPRGE